MAPPSFLWVIATSGRVFTLSTVGKRWKEVEANGGTEIEFKRVSAHTSCAWAIGCDHMLYTFVHATDVPIVKRVETYENQRWSPMSGYSDQLLPTDRYHWSDESGLVNSPKSSFELPSKSWVWEPNASGGDGWALDATCDGVPTVDKEGWQYAVDFPAQYTPDMKFTSCVRRRRWIKFRRYVATDRWSKIPGVHADPNKEPFVDVAVGGYDLPGRRAAGFRQVWAVTILGKVAYRHGVSTDSPEGTHWEMIPTQPGSEVLNLSVGPRGLVWAVTWDGHCLVRLGVGKEKEVGTYWDIVFPPDDSDHKFLQVAVGTDIVWVVTRSGKVFYRKGIRAVMAPHEKDFAMGTEWVEMTGLMSSVSVGPDDQVWAIGLDDRLVYFRTGVTKDDPGGKMWKSIILPIMPKINFSSEANPVSMLGCRRDSSVSSDGGGFEEKDTRKKFHGSRDSGLGVGGSGSNSPKPLLRQLSKAGSKAKLSVAKESSPPQDLTNTIPDIRVDSVNSSASDSSDR